MTRQEATRILDEVIPPPEHPTVDLDHLRIAQAWLCIKETLTAEPKHGRWIDRLAVNKNTKEERNARECSLCGAAYFVYKEVDVVPNYCPNCGARMDEVGNGNTD